MKNWNVFKNLFFQFSSRCVAKMNKIDKNLSLQFFNNLCYIDGSEEVVQTRREIYIARDIFQNDFKATFKSSGSKAEGIDLEGSDYDQMLFLKSLRVYESLDNGQSYPVTLPFVMETSDTNPGFTKLK